MEKQGKILAVMMAVALIASASLVGLFYARHNTDMEIFGRTAVGEDTKAQQEAVYDGSTIPGVDALGGYNNWNNGNRVIISQDGTFKITNFDCHGSGTPNGGITKMTITHNMLEHSAINPHNLHIMMDADFGLIRLWSPYEMLPGLVDSKSYERGSTDFVPQGKRYIVSNVGLDFQGEGVYILQGYLNIHRMHYSQIIKEHNSFLTDPFIIGSSLLSDEISMDASGTMLPSFNVDPQYPDYSNPVNTENAQKQSYDYQIQ